MPHDEHDRQSAGRSGRELQRFARDFLTVDTGDLLDPGQVVEHAARSVPHAAGAGLTLVRGDRPPVTLAATSDLAEKVDAIQYAAGEGPCLEAIADDDITYVADLTRTDRWPRFSERVVAETPVRSSFGVRIFLSGTDRGALNFYSIEPNAFTDLDLGIGAVFATVAGLALRNSIQAQKNANLEIALQSSRQIGMAMGILMSSKLLTADEAFEQLRDASQRLHRRVRDVAEEVAETGALPELPDRRRADG
jgi:hypothetical protein